jgi:hypothetical protein
MPADFIIKTGDMIQITIPPPTIVPQLAAPVPMVGSAATVLTSGMATCVSGDEVPPSVRGPLTYTAPPYLTPGTGILTIILLPTNLTVPTNTGGKPIIIKGSTFMAKFTVAVPAVNPITGDPDPLAEKVGTAQFITSNVLTKAG